MPHRPARRPRRTARPRSFVRSVVAAAAGGLTLLAAAGTAFAAGPSGVDVASFQHTNGVAINWSAVRSSGVSFAYIKATESSGYTNPWFATDFAAARSAGIYRGGYHFARPSTASGSAAAQARYYVSVNGLAHGSGDLPPMLDLEVSGGLSPAQLQSWTQTWLTTVKSLTGRDPVIYTGPYFWRTAMGNSTAFTNYPLFIASYSTSAPSVPGGWPWWTFWQSSSSGRVGGIIGNVDVDQFNGDAAGLARMANVTGASAPAPAPTPTPTPSAPGNPSASGFPPPPAGASHDLTSDGIPDVVARDAAGALWTYPGDGHGGWKPRIKTGLYGWDLMNAVLVAGDMNGDGKADVIARDRAAYLYLYPGDGKGGLGPRVRIGNNWQHMTALVGVGDLSGDGKNDLVARDDAGYLWLYTGTGKGGLNIGRSRIGGGWNVMTALVGVGDMTGDGKVDMIARDRSGYLWLYPGNGRGIFGVPTRIGSSWQYMTALLGSGDLNGDGKADLVARDGSGRLWLYPGDGRGHLGIRTQVGSGWQTKNLLT